MQLAKTFGGKKYMWDGAEYGNREAADEVMRRYRADHFEVEAVEEGGVWFVFSRREAGRAVEGPEPA